MNLELLRLVLVTNNVLVILVTKPGLQQLVLVINSALAILVMKLELQQHAHATNSVLARLVILLIVVVVINNVHVRQVIAVVRAIVLVYLYVLGIAQQMKQILN